MTISEFEEKAIKGGWEAPKRGSLASLTIETTLLDPQAWIAMEESSGFSSPLSKERAGIKMHNMISHLINGGTIESFLTTL